MTTAENTPSASPSFLTQNHPLTPHLLIVDSHVDILDELILLLSTYQIRLFTASNGQKALHILREEKIDVLILEIDLPDMNGLEVMDFIKKHHYDTHTIILSENTSIEAPIEALKRHAFNYLKKPYATEELLCSLKKVLDTRVLQAQQQHKDWQLACSEKLHRGLVDNAPDIIFTLNKEGFITYVNERINPILGYLPQDMIGRHYSYLINNDDLERAEPFFNNKYQSTRHTELLLKSGAEKESYPFSLTIMNLTFDPGCQDTTTKKGGMYVIAQDLSEKKRVAQIISYHKSYDLLTGLPNRNLLIQQLNTELLRQKENKGGMTILFIDLNDFKLINDTIGHLNGDLLLQQVGIRLKELVRTGDIVSRLRSDEFLIALPGLKERKRAQEIAMCCLESMQKPFMINNDEHVQITASIGIAISPENGLSATELIAHAGMAVDHIRSNGKNDFCFYDDHLICNPHTKISLEQEMRRALERNQLEIYYQPQVDTQHAQIIGAEAFMRWNHPERGLLSAGEFLPYAEEIGLTIPYTDWMLGSVCRDIRAAKLAGCHPTPISVNLSPQYLEQEDCIEKMKKIFSYYRIKEGEITADITENMGSHHLHHAIRQLERLNGLGVQIAIDDFGTGYSSLAYLRKFPIKTIKINRSFISEIPNDNSGFPVILAIISLAQGLKMNLIAAGVETETQAACLQNWGCHVMQGHLYYSPMPIHQMISLMIKQPIEDYD